jgi:hypothetical protein
MDKPKPKITRHENGAIALSYYDDNYPNEHNFIYIEPDDVSEFLVELITKALPSKEGSSEL